MRQLGFLFLLATSLFCLAAPAADDIAPSKVIRPRQLKSPSPQYSPEARTARVEGIVLLSVVVLANGATDHITVISPLGYGLDEEAIKAVSAWRFQPGMKNGKPVDVRVYVEVTFRLKDGRSSSPDEKKRTAFNRAIQAITEPAKSPIKLDSAAAVIAKLADEQYPPAMYWTGMWKIEGKYLDKAPDEGLALIKKAAGKDYDQALFEIGSREIEGRDLPKDPKNGLEKMSRAARNGNRSAQWYLGNAFEMGTTAERNPDKAQRYFRLCAAKGEALCQYHLGKLILDDPNHKDREYIEALAWLQLSTEAGALNAKPILDKELPKLTPAQSEAIKRLQAQLVQK